MVEDQVCNDSLVERGKNSQQQVEVGLVMVVIWEEMQIGMVNHSDTDIREEMNSRALQELLTNQVVIVEDQQMLVVELQQLKADNLAVVIVMVDAGLVEVRVQRVAVEEVGAVGTEEELEEGQEAEDHPTLEG